jgi:hypothetical protein
MPSLAQKAIGGVIAPLVGLVVLIPFCLAQAWEPCLSSGGPWPVHDIDRWKWAPLNRVYANPEDGVSGAYALVWEKGTGRRVPYKAPFTQWAPWRAYCWSAWRNSADQLKYTYGE